MRWHYRDTSTFERRREAYEHAVAEAVRDLLRGDPKITRKWKEAACKLTDAEIVAVVACEPIARERGLVGVGEALQDEGIELPWYVLKTLLMYTAAGGTKLPPREFPPEQPISAFLRDLRALVNRPVQELMTA